MPTETLCFKHSKGAIGFGVSHCLLGCLIIGMSIVLALKNNEETIGILLFAAVVFLFGFVLIIMGLIYFIGSRRFAIILTDDSIIWRGIRGTIMSIPYWVIENIIEDSEGGFILALRENPQLYLDRRSKIVNRLLDLVLLVAALLLARFNYKKSLDNEYRIQIYYIYFSSNDTRSIFENEIRKKIRV